MGRDTRRSLDSLFYRGVVPFFSEVHRLAVGFPSLGRSIAEADQRAVRTEARPVQEVCLVSGVVLPDRKSVV